MAASDTSYNESVIAYYDLAEVSYRDIWDLDRSMALHYGFWDGTVDNFPQSLLKTNQVLAGMLAPQAGEKILDAGCGVGGSSIFLASEYGCQTTGISLSEKQIASARANATRKGVEKLCLFQVGDFIQTGFPDRSFDAVWALESVCHAKEKRAFLMEAFRVLKPGGRLVMADGFRKPGLDEEGEKLLQQWLQGWSIHDLETIENMQDLAAGTGFGTITVRDFSDNIRPTSLRMYRFGLLARTYGKLMNFLGKKYGNPYTISNTIGAIAQYRALQKQLWRYMAMHAVKK